jgi:ketosteroid isomerase-like protein
MRRYQWNARDLKLNSTSAGVILVCLFFCCVRAGAIVHTHSPHQHHVIEQLEQQYRQAMLDDNTAVMDRMLADSYVGIEPNGMIETKAETIDNWRNHKIAFSQLDLSEVHVRIYGKTAVVTSKARVVGHGIGGIMDGEYRYTRVYNEQNGQWRIVSFEANRIANPSRASGS